MMDLLLVMLGAALYGVILWVAVREYSYFRLAKSINREFRRRKSCHGNGVRCTLVPDHPAVAAAALETTLVPHI